MITLQVIWLSTNIYGSLLYIYQYYVEKMEDRTSNALHVLHLNLSNSVPVMVMMGRTMMR